MTEKMRIGIFVDSFYPIVDGVSQVVNNYCQYLNEYEDVEVTLVTPRYRGGDYGKYAYRIYPYLSFGSNSKVSYRVGWPFVPKTVRELKDMKFDLIHIHSPLCSSELVRLINKNRGTKVVLTYHTKYDVDFEARLKGKLIKKVAYSFLEKNINDPDEVWIVSEGSESALRRVGFRGNCRVMENGVDFVKGAASPEKCKALKEKYHLPAGVPVFTFVGRMQWYKNIHLVIDALDEAKKMGLDFRMLFVGDGFEREEMQAEVAKKGLNDKVIFTGSVNDREALRVFYSITDLFLFLSTFDTAAIVVKEAAACDCPVLFARGSDSAYGVTDGVNGWFTEENARSMAKKLVEITADPERMKEVGEKAGETLYVPWKDSVHRAYCRYSEILGRKIGETANV